MFSFYSVESIIEILEKTSIILLRGERMLECISDYLSFGLLMAFPISWLALLVIKLFRKRRAKLLANQEKFYREW